MSAAPARVIFVNRVYWPSPAATAQLLTDLAEALADQGWAVHVIAAGHEAGPRNGVTLHRAGGSTRPGGLLRRFASYGRFLLRARSLLARLVQPGDVVVLMTDPPMLGAVTARVAAAHGARVMHWVQDIYPEIIPAHAGAVLRPLLRPLQAWRDAAWRSAAVCITLGSTMAETVQGRGVPAARIAIIPNWAPRELDEAATDAACRARRTAWGLSGEFIVAYSGNLGRVHEFMTVLAAAEQLRNRADILFLFIGAGARLAGLQAAAHERGLSNIRFLPPEPREHLAAALAAPDAQLVTLQPVFAPLVYPSKLAGVLAAGRPVLFVGPGGGEIARLLAAADCGLAFAPGDGPGLADAIVRLQADPVRRLALGRAARAAYAGQFSLRLLAARWGEILRLAASG